MGCSAIDGSALSSRSDLDNPSWARGAGLNIETSTRTDEAGPASVTDPKFLLSQLKLLQANHQRLSKSSIHKEVKNLWSIWDQFLKTPNGKTLSPSTFHLVTHEFLFLYPSKISQILENIEARQLTESSAKPDSRIFKSIGLASLRYQNWAVLQRLLSCQRNMEKSDIVNLLKSACRKILFSSSFKAPKDRIEKLDEISQAITDNFNEKIDCMKCTIQLIEVVSDALLRIGHYESATQIVLQVIHQRTSSAKFFSSRFLHRLMNTCVSHHHISIAHALLAKLPPECQTLEHFKACMSVWDRRTPRPLLRSACSVWDALASHPHLVPDHEAYDLYISLKSKLGHVADVMRIISGMERKGMLINSQKQKTYGILLHSISRRKGLASTYKILPELISKGYKPDEYTSNILLSAKRSNLHDEPAGSPNFSIPKSERREERLIQTIQEIKTANMKSDEVTRNIVIRSFLSRFPHHSKEEILHLKAISLDQLNTNAIDNVDRKQFRRFRKPLYSMLCSAFRRAHCLDELSKLKDEWKRESFKARLNTVKVLQKG